MRSFAQVRAGDESAIAEVAESETKPKIIAKGVTQIANSRVLELCGNLRQIARGTVITIITSTVRSPIVRTVPMETGNASLLRRRSASLEGQPRPPATNKLILASGI